MSAGTRTFGLDETFIEPKVLPPPPTRHALFAFLLVLTAILHIGTIGWSDIANGAEGHYAGGAREMLRAGSWFPPAVTSSGVRDAPLTYWLLILSYKVFGVVPMAARLPVAGAMLASVAFTFLIGERLGGYWRGFVAGLVHVCSLGAFVPGRIVTPEPIFAALLGGAIFCAVRGYQTQRKRPIWFAGVWLCGGLICLTKGPAGLLYLAIIFLLLGLFFREARLRFRQLLRWPYLAVFFAAGFATLFFAGWKFGGGLDAEGGVSIWRFLGTHFLWWSPGLLLVLPGFCFAPRRIFRPHEFGFADALPLCWAVVGFVPLLFLETRQDYGSVSMWSGFALIIAWAWERTPRGLRIAGVLLVALFALTAALRIASGRFIQIPESPDELGATFGPMLLASALALSVACVVAAFFASRDRETLAITIVLLATTPLGLSIAEGWARGGPFISLASVAGYLQHRLGENGELLYEGAADGGSSLRFYLDRPYALVTQSDDVLEKFRQPHPVYLITGRERIPFWQEQLTERFHLYHQVTTCGDHVVITNTP